VLVTPLCTLLSSLFNDIITKRAKTLLQNAAAHFITKRANCLLQNTAAFLLQNEPFLFQNAIGITK